MMDTENMIVFDSSDWNSIRDAINKINDFGAMQFGKTDLDETIIFDVCKDEDGNDMLVTTVIQGNGWIRKTYYHPEDYTIEEMFERE